MTSFSSEQHILSGQQRARELIAKGAALTEALEELTHLIEKNSRHDVLCSILLLDESGQHLLHGAAPSLPRAYQEAIDGIAIGPDVGSCGTAAYGGHIVMVQDIASDPLWMNFRGLALEHGLRACWSTPIFSPDRKVLGTFAIYHREPRSPSLEDRKLIERLCETAAEIILAKRI